ncbi:MAG: hypothetical protein QXT28_09295 [Thermofilaceae archaeon]
MAEERKRVARTPEELIFFTDTGQQDYPIFIAPGLEVSIKRRPQAGILATFYVTSVEALEEGEEAEKVTHPLLEKAINTVQEVTKNEAKVKKLKITYEIYRGDREELLGTAVGYAIKVRSVDSPYSGDKWESKRAYAIAFDWKKRIAARAPELSPFLYVDGKSAKRGKAWAWVVVKLPVATPELAQLFKAAVTGATAVVTAAPPAAAAPAEEVGELRPPELELELELPAVTGTTAVVQPAPVTAPATAPPAPPTPRGLEEEARDLLQRLLREQGYVTATIIAFDLPSEYRASSSTWEEDEEGRYREVLTLSRSAAEVARLRTLRKKFYALLNAYCFRSPLGWILMDPAGAAELRSAAEVIVKEAGGQLHWLELPVPKAWLIEQAEGARARLAASEEEVIKTLADAALSAALRRRLMKRKEELEAALRRLAAFLESLR